MLANNWRKGRCRWTLAGALVALPIGLTACDLEVVNPGPVADQFLDHEAAFDAIVNAVARRMSYAMNVAGLDTGLRTREIHALANDQWRGVTFTAHIGASTTEGTSYTNPWQFGQGARWIGEDVIRRMRGVLDESRFRSHPSVARAHLWTGYANRLLGEYFCQAVFDGGPALAGDEFYKTAEARFTTAIEVGTAANLPEIVTAAHAGRASVRVQLKNWPGAIEDAGRVPTDFDFFLPYESDGAFRYYNVFVYSGRDLDAAFTVWNTPYLAYYQQTGDPRTPWVESVARPIRTTTLAPWTEIPVFRQQKYTALDDDIRLSSGAEMRLIQAEAHLRAGNIAPAMALINALRTGVGVAPWPAPASLEEAWSLLKRERGIELWLEGRRLADFRRWAETSTPGALDPHELGGTNGGPDLSGRALCLPIPQSEIDQNPNL